MITKVLIFLLFVSLAYVTFQFLKQKKENYELKTFILNQKYTPKTDEDVAREDFLKFISDSREWAFEYIENVQNAYNKFNNAVKKDIEYFDKYGDNMALKPNYEMLQRFSMAYKEFKDVFPDAS